MTAPKEVQADREREHWATSPETHDFFLNFIRHDLAVPICSTCGWFGSEAHPVFAQGEAEMHLADA